MRSQTRSNKGHPILGDSQGVRHPPRVMLGDPHEMSGIDRAVVRLPGASHDMSRRPSQLTAKIANIVAWFERYRTGPVTN